MTPKETVRNYYKADLANDQDLMKDYFRKDCILNWHSSKGFKSLDYQAIKEIYQNIKRNYKSTRVEISHILGDGNFVTTRYTLFVEPVETPDEEFPTAHFISIWELKDGKLFRGHEISQLADAAPESLSTFNKFYGV